MPMLAHGAGAIVKEMPVTHHPRTAGRTKCAMPSQIVPLVSLPAFSEELIDPESPLPMSHVASICEVADGRLAAVWYAGSREGAKDVAIFFATQHLERRRAFLDAESPINTQPVLQRQRTGQKPAGSARQRRLAGAGLSLRSSCLGEDGQIALRYASRGCLSFTTQVCLGGNCKYRRMKSLTFYHQKRKDGGVCTGVELDGERVLEQFKPGGGLQDSALEWFGMCVAGDNAFRTIPKRSADGCSTIAPKFRSTWSGWQTNCGWAWTRTGPSRASWPANRVALPSKSYAPPFAASRAGTSAKSCASWKVRGRTCSSRFRRSARKWLHEVGVLMGKRRFRILDTNVLINYWRCRGRILK